MYVITLKDNPQGIYSVFDAQDRLQIPEEYLKQTGIENTAIISIKGDEIIIKKEHNG